MTIQATNNFVIIKRDEPEKETGGMIIPSKGLKKPHCGTILSTGDLVQDINIKSGVGKKAYFFDGKCMDVPFDEQDFGVLTDSDIIWVV